MYCYLIGCRLVVDLLKAMLQRGAERVVDQLLHVQGVGHHSQGLGSNKY